MAPTACLNGPLIIDEDAEIRHCAFVRGSAIVGKGSVVGNSTELKMILFSIPFRCRIIIMLAIPFLAINRIWVQVRSRQM